MGSGAMTTIKKTSHVAPRAAPGGKRVATDLQIRLNRPLLPEIQDLLPYLKDILQNRWVTNDGKYVRTLEQKLADYLKCPGVALVTNGTVGLDLALRALLPDGGDVITTAYSFPATYHVLLNNPNITPVFVDIDDNYCLDPEAVADAVTPRTRAILAVHTYGYPCDHERLEAVARENGLLIIYDAAHAFGVIVGGRGIGTLGDVSVFSFHAAKVFNTLEGGCVTSGESTEIIDRIRLFRNFGIRNEDEIVLCGLNGKMDEIRAVFGLLNLRLVDEAITKRKRVVTRYLSYFEALSPPDITIRVHFYLREDLVLNYSYFPILIHPSRHFHRDVVYTHMRASGIEVRKYFYPVVTESPIYEGLYHPGRLQRTAYASRNILCLPVHHEMTEEDCDRVVEVFDQLYRRTH